MVKPVSILVTGFGVSAFPLHRRMHRFFTTCWRQGVGDMNDQEGRDGRFLQTSRTAASSVNNGDNHPLHSYRSSLILIPLIAF